MIKDFHNYIFDVMTMCNKDEWAQKFQKHQEDMLDFFVDLHNLSFHDVVERINEHGEYLESQFMGFHMITFLSKYFGDNSNITEAFLKRFKHRISRDKIKIYEKLNNIYFSVYKIVDVKPGEYNVIKDILFGTNEIKVNERLGSRKEMIGHHVLASVVENDGKYSFTGVLLPIDECDLDEMTFAIKNRIKESKLSCKGMDLAPIDKVRILLYRSYSTFFYYVFKSYIFKSKIINDNGDEFEPKVCWFKINKKEENEEIILKMLTSSFYQKEYQIILEDENLWTLYFLRKSSKQYKKSELTRDDYLVYGEISIDGDCLKVVILYPNQANKIIQILKKKLKDMIGMAVIEDAQLDKEECKENLQSVDTNGDIPDYVKQELFQKFFDKHLKETLKTKIPVLHNLTPKQCLKKDPETFYRWLEDFKLNILEQSEGLYDFSWFLEKLGI